MRSNVLNRIRAMRLAFLYSLTTRLFFDMGASRVLFIAARNLPAITSSSRLTTPGSAFEYSYNAVRSARSWSVLVKVSPFGLTVEGSLGSRSRICFAIAATPLSPGAPILIVSCTRDGGIPVASAVASSSEEYPGSFRTARFPANTVRASSCKLSML